MLRSTIKATVLPVLAALLLFACNPEEEITPDLSIDHQESLTRTPQPVVVQPVTKTINYHDYFTIRTTRVPGATKYYWTVDDQATITTSLPEITLRGRDIVWLPPGGCKDFNKNWTSGNPLFNKSDLCSWQGQIPLGTLKVKFSSKAENSTVKIDNTIYVVGVELCRDSDSCKGDDKGIFDPFPPSDDDKDPIGGGSFGG